MSAARLLASGAVFAACVTAGAVRASRMELRIKNTHALSADIARLKGFVCSERIPLDEAAERLRASGGLKPLWEGVCGFMRRGCDLARAYSEAVKPELVPEATAVLDELFSALGKGDSAAELERLGSACLRLERVCAEASAEGGKSRRLIQKLSLLLGIAAALLIL